MSRVWSAVLCLAATLSPGIAQPLDPALYADLRWRLVGPFRGGWGTVAEGVPDDPADLLLRQRGRRRVEDAGRGPHVVADLRPRGLGFGRRARGGSIESRSDLRRHRPDPGAIRHRLGRRHVSLGRRRRHVAARRTRGLAGDRTDPRRPQRRERGARRGTRPHVRPEPGARRLSHRGRREELEAGPLSRREHRRRGPGGRSGQSLHRLRLAVAGAQLSLALLLQADGRSGQRDLQVDGCGPQLEAPLRRRLAGGEPRAHRSRGLFGRARVGARGCRRRAGQALRGGRPLALGRRRRHVDARQRDARPRLELHEPASPRIRAIATRSTSWDSPSGVPRTAGRR